MMHIVMDIMVSVVVSIMSMVGTMDGISFLLKQLLHVQSVHGKVIICTAGSH